MLMYNNGKKAELFDLTVEGVTHFMLVCSPGVGVSIIVPLPCRSVEPSS